MKILYIDHYAGSPQMGMEFRPYYLSREWIKHGHNVTIMAADYSHLRRKNPTVTRDFEEEAIDGIRYLWVKTRRYSGNGVSRAMSMRDFVGKVKQNAGWIVDHIDPDVIITSSTYHLDTFAGQRIKKKSGHAKLIHEVHDMWPATLIEIGGMSRRNPFVMMIQAAENSAYKESDAIVSLLPNTKDYMAEHGMAEDKFHHLPNGIVIDEWQNPVAIPEDYKKEIDSIKNDGKFIVGYFGGHAFSNALNYILDVASEMRHEDVHFILVGDGVEKRKLIERAENESLDNITFMDPIEKKYIPDLCSHFDCIYIGGHPTPLYRFGLAINKMQEAMFSGKPVIAAITASNNVLSDEKCGICLNSGDVEGICAAIRQLTRSESDIISEMTIKAVEIIRQRYTYESIAQQFETLFLG